MTAIQKLESELMAMHSFPEKDYLSRRVKELRDTEQMIIMKSYADGLKALRDSIITDEMYDSYLEYYNKNYNKECLQPSL